MPWCRGRSSESLARCCCTRLSRLSTRPIGSGRRPHLMRTTPRPTARRSSTPARRAAATHICWGGWSCRRVDKVVAFMMVFFRAAAGHAKGDRVGEAWAGMCRSWRRKGGGEQGCPLSGWRTRDHREVGAGLGFESVTTVDRWRNLPADQAVKTPTKPAVFVRANARASVLITFGLLSSVVSASGAGYTVAGSSPAAQAATRFCDQRMLLRALQRLGELPHGAARVLERHRPHPPGAVDGAVEQLDSVRRQVFG
jgi:hypothetical protein